MLGREEEEKMEEEVLLEVGEKVVEEEVVLEMKEEVVVLDVEEGQMMVSVSG